MFRLEEELQDEISKLKAENEALKLRLSDAGDWIAYDWNKLETRPKVYGKYFICRKDGKVHWETWNGSGWAYNNEAITHYREIKPPVVK